MPTSKNSKKPIDAAKKAVDSKKAAPAKKAATGEKTVTAKTTAAAKSAPKAVAKKSAAAKTPAKKSPAKKSSSKGLIEKVCSCINGYCNCRLNRSSGRSVKARSKPVLKQPESARKQRLKHW